ncbi:hypothetical protein FRB96_002884 [Tulasnella sp. 330]|nr:hypothetical protein FRB96_002884 [Tulasnella sp. 330]KAG8884960.1 hypothetical protein FRB97_002788 [Tulasnella sp. 331]KAG8889270.1 hypothetical protein FRB98_005083 [Tulasnella sp. 332]
MSKPEEFEKLLKSAVASSRLSQSKMESLVKLAMKSMENDTQMVSILYRTHKTLPTTSKIPSLYIFDSLARAARSQATKHRADASSSTGNAATFLVKMEGILDGLIQDMIAIGTTESKEKTVKILDIWTKANTFSPVVMTRLVGLTQGSTGPAARPASVDNSNKPLAVVASTSSSGENSQAPTPVVDPRRPAQKQQLEVPVAAAVVPTPQPNVDASAALLALLAQAQGASSKTTTNATLPTDSNAVGTAPAALPGLDLAQVALLQQIAGQLPGAPQQQQPVNQSHGWPNGGTSSTNGGSDAYDNGREDHSGYNDRDQRQYDRPRDDRFANGGQHDRGGYNDGRGGFPPRRGTNDRGRWNDGRRGNGRREWDNHDNGRRSRSPPAPRDRLGARSAQNGNGSLSPSTSRPGQNLSAIPVHDPSTTTHPVNTQQPIPSIGAETASEGPAAFDLSAFDPTNPDSWTELGEAWRVTNGRYPTQEELMMFVASSGAGAAGAVPIVPMANADHEMNGGDQMANVPPSQWNNEHMMEPYNGGGGRGFGGQRGFPRGRGRGGGYADRGGGGNRGGFGPGFNSQPIWNGNAVDPSASMNHHHMGNGGGGYNAPTVRQPGNGPTSIVDAVIADAQKGISSENDDPSRPKPAGKMIKVGDRWKWVKGGD